MTFMHELANIFNAAFAHHEKSRMYPPNKERSLAMVKLKHAHVLSLNTARLFLHKAFERTQEQRFKREIESDIEHLDQLKLILMHALANPELPFGQIGDLDGTKNRG